MSTVASEAAALPPLDGTAKRDLADRAQRMIAELRLHGGGSDGSVTRLVYSPEWQKAMEQVERWYANYGLDLHADAVGSRFGRLPGVQTDVIMTGSHIDSVRHGGAFDGALGVIIGTIAVGWLKENCGTPRRSLEVWANCEEESSRFPGNFWGARALTGRIAESELEEVRDHDGTSIGDAMRSCDLDPAAIPSARREDITCFIESHIEQGTRLESAGATIGVVQRVVGVRQMYFRLIGSSGHAGTMPMDDRRDALVAAAELVGLIKEIARHTGGSAVATVGFIEAVPGGANQIPEEVRLTVDFRHPDVSMLDKMEDEIRRCGKEASQRHLLGVQEHIWLSQAPVDFHPVVREVIEQSCMEAQCDWMPLDSGAGHDAQVIAQDFPTGMLFVPSKGGHSHRPDEETTIEDIVVGTEVLIRVLYRLGYMQ